MVLIVVAVIAAIYLLSSIKILPEYERGVIFRFGRLLPDAKGPGLIFVFAPIDRLVRVSLRQSTLEVSSLDFTTHDDYSMKVTALITIRVIDPCLAVMQVADYVHSTSQLALVTLRSVLGEAKYDELYSQRDQLSNRVKELLIRGTTPWGVTVDNIDLKEIDRI